MKQLDKLKVLVDVAFNNNVKKVCKKSFDKAIDVQYGVYTGEGHYKGFLTINLKPSHGKLDWKINFDCIGIGDKEKVHRGYYKEISKYWNEFYSITSLNEELYNAKLNGIIISGRSKGGGEAFLISSIMRDVENAEILVGGIEAPKIGNDVFCKNLESKLGKHNIIFTIYKNDIVPGVPPWFKLPGNEIQIGTRWFPLSFRDHRKSTENEEIFYDYINKNLGEESK